MVTKNQGIAALLLNIFILPGLGTVIWGEKKTGWFQLVLALVSIPLMLILVGFLTWFCVWVWGIVSGVQILKSATEPAATPVATK